MLQKYKATIEEQRQALPGDELVKPGLVVDSAFTLDHATPGQVMPWLGQLGMREEGKAGWYFPDSIERLAPNKLRSDRHIDSDKQVKVGDNMGDWSGATLTAVEVNPDSLVYEGLFKGKKFSWTLVANPTEEGGTRVQSRTRIADIKHPRMAKRIGSLADRTVAAALAGGLRDRLQEARHATPPHDTDEA